MILINTPPAWPVVAGQISGAAATASLFVAIVPGCSKRGMAEANTLFIHWWVVEYFRVVVNFVIGRRLGPFSGGIVTHAGRHK